MIGTGQPEGAPGRPAGFTLIELLIVIAILALLAGLVIPVYVGVNHSVKVKICAHNLRCAANALRFYGDQHKRFPPAADAVDVAGAYYERTAHDFLSQYLGAGDWLMQTPLHRPSSFARLRPAPFTCPAADRDTDGFHFALAVGIFYQPTPQISDLAGHNRIPSGPFRPDGTLAFMADGAPDAGHMLSLGDGMIHGLNIERHAAGRGPDRTVGANYLYADGHVQFSSTAHLEPLESTPWNVPQ